MDKAENSYVMSSYLFLIFVKLLFHCRRDTVWRLALPKRIQKLKVFSQQLCEPFSKGKKRNRGKKVSLSIFLSIKTIISYSWKKLFFLASIWKSLSCFPYFYILSSWQRQKQKQNWLFKNCFEGKDRKSLPLNIWCL